ncbi:hypothetical protein NKH18_26505 [Streptomyces sp. M10(2022)]
MTKHQIAARSVELAAVSGDVAEVYALMRELNTMAGRLVEEVRGMRAEVAALRTSRPADTRTSGRQLPA